MGGYKQPPKQDKFYSGFGLVWFGFSDKWHVNLCGLLNPSTIITDEQ